MARTHRPANLIVDLMTRLPPRRRPADAMGVGNALAIAGLNRPISTSYGAIGVASWVVFLEARGGGVAPPMVVVRAAGFSRT